MRTVKAGGLAGTQLVISDAQIRLKSAIAAVLLGAAWQRCRVHWMRTVLAQVPRGNSEMVAAAIRTIIAPPDADHMRSQLDVSLACSAASSREVEAMLDDDGDRAPHRRRRRLPNPEALRRLAGAVLVEAHD